MKSIVCVATALLFGVVQVGCASGAARTPEARRPNIVLIIADDLGWTDISTGATNGGNGSSYVQTPTIERLAKQGMSFSNMHVYPNCAPSRAALMTGQDSFRNGVFNVGSLARGEGRLQPARQQGEHIRNEAVTLAETLKAAGYATGHVGKYHVSSYENVTKHDGFDVNYGGGRKGDGGPKGHFAVEENGQWTFRAREKEMDRFAEPYGQAYVDRNLEPYANGNDPQALVGTPKHLTDADTDAAIDFMTQHVESGQKSVPFFISVAFSAVHTAIVPRPDLLAKYKDHPVGQTRQNKPEFAALTEGVDQAIARILRLLDEKGLADNTLLLFTSDNGGSGAGPRNAPLRASKGTFYEGGIRVPMIARLPGVIEPETTSDALLNVVDLYCTMADFAGATLPDPSQHALDGNSFTEILRGRTGQSPRDAMYYHFPGYLDTRAYPCSLILKQRAGSLYKLIYSYEDQHFELYNLTDDLGESHDLLQGDVSQSTLAIAESLRNDLHSWLSQNRPAMPTDPATAQTVPLPIEISAALKAGNKIKRPVDSGAEEQRKPRDGD